MKNTLKENPINNLRLNIKNQTISDLRITTSKKKTKKIMSEQKTPLSSLRLEKVNKLLKYIPTDITEMNKLIYTGAKLVYDKINISQRNTNRNTKPEWERIIEGQS